MSAWVRFYCAADGGWKLTHNIPFSFYCYFFPLIVILFINPPAIPTAYEPEVIPAKRGVGSPAIPTAFVAQGDPSQEGTGLTS